MSNASLKVKRLSALAQVIIELRERGITSTSEITKVTGYCSRSVWRARAELKQFYAEVN